MIARHGMPAQSIWHLCFALILGASLGCGAQQARQKKQKIKPVAVAFQPTLAVEPGAFDSHASSPPDYLIVNGLILTADDDEPRFSNGWIRLSQGRIEGLGAGQPPPRREGERLLDLKGTGVITPGLVDTHSHLGVYSSPHVWAHSGWK